MNELVESLCGPLAEIRLEDQNPKPAEVERHPRIAVEIWPVATAEPHVGSSVAATKNELDISELKIPKTTDQKCRPAGLNVKDKKQTQKPPKGPSRKTKCRSIDAYARPILDEAMSIKRVEDFSIWADRAGDMFDVEKIAEGSYGEVYQLRVRNETSKRELSKSKIAKLKSYDNGVFKIVPIRAKSGAGSKKFTSIDEVVAEVQMLKLLDPIPGFARFREVHVVQGRFPPSYQKAWVHYSKTRDDCYNPDPSKKKAYPDNQLWAILEMDNAGHELEKFNCSSIFQIYDIFWGVALALARAEQFAAFEHRDLHLGNICIKQGPRKPFLPQRSECIASGFGLSGMETTIIDYSLSRACLGTDEASIDDIAWSDLDKKRLFDAIGRDDDEKLLRDTYRLMRMEVYRDQDLDSTENPQCWKEFSPRTNLTWLSFLLVMLLSKGKANGILPTAREPLSALSLNKINAKCNPRKGAEKEKFALPGPDFRLSLLDRLQTVIDLLNPDDQEEEGEDEEAMLFCAGDLVAFAIASHWLSESDFLC